MNLHPAPIFRLSAIGTVLAVACCLFAAGCSTPNPSGLQAGTGTDAAARPIAYGLSGDMSPTDAVLGAAKRPTAGTFLMMVKATGKEEDQVFLNSEKDYRDQRCLTVVIPCRLVKEFRAKYERDPADYFKGKKIRVSGLAERVRIWFTIGGVVTDKYYYQTHLRLHSIDQITLLEKGEGPAKLSKTLQVETLLMGRRERTFFPISVDTPYDQKRGQYEDLLVRPGRRRVELGVHITQPRSGGYESRMAQAGLWFVAAPGGQYQVNGKIQADVAEFWITDAETGTRVSEVVSGSVGFVNYINNSSVNKK